MRKLRSMRKAAVMALSLVLAGFALGVIAGGKIRPAPARADQAGGVNVTGIYDVGIFTNNVKGLAAFYDKLGFHRAISSDNIVVFSMPNQDLAIVKHDAQGKTNLLAVGLYVNDLAPVTDNLRKQGIPFDGPKPLEAYLNGVMVHDPNGNEVHFLLPKD